MEPALKKRRVSAKKSRSAKIKPIDVPPNIPYPNIENLLRHSLCRQWISFEWQYDEVEDAFFNKLNTFQQIVSNRFPQLKCHNLTAAEWRKIRTLITACKTRRFSSKFIAEQRIELEKYRQCFNVLRENNQIDQLAKLNALVETFAPVKSNVDVDNGHQSEVCSLIVRVKKCFATKHEIVAELRDINNAKANNSNDDDDGLNSSTTAAITQLRKCNQEIVDGLSKLMAFRIVKDTLLFDAISNNKMQKALSPIYFRRKSELQIFENHREFNSMEFITLEPVKVLMNALLEQALSIIKTEQLAADAEDFMRSIVMEHLDLLKPIMTEENIDYFQTSCLPMMFDIIKKVCP